MESPSLFLETLPGTAMVYVVAGALVIAALLAGLVVLAIAIRGEDAPNRLGAHEPGPIARKVRHMLDLHVYTGTDLRRATTGSRSHRGPERPLAGTRR